MTAIDPRAQELWQEFIAHHPDLESDKEHFLTLFERMILHRPEIKQDEFFESQLRDRLRYHLISRHEPAPEINRWQTLLVYGVPSVVVLSAFLIFGLPQMDIGSEADMQQAMPASVRMMDAPLPAENPERVIENDDYILIYQFSENKIIGFVELKHNGLIFSIAPDTSIEEGITTITAVQDDMVVRIEVEVQDGDITKILSHY